MRDTIETPRLTLRPFGAGDAAPVAELVGDWDVARMLARVPHPYSIEDAQAWFATQPETRASGRDFPFAITTAHDGVIGCVGIHKPPGEEGFTLGYWLGRLHWGRGYATEAGAALLAHATEDLGLTHFHSEHFVGNDVSGRVLQKLGFAYTGEVRSMHCLARGADVEARQMARSGPTKDLGGGSHG